jgi:hypothetical protein
MKTKTILSLTAILLTGCAHEKHLAQEYPYHEPLSSPGKTFSGLPPAVQSSIRAQVGAADMFDMIKTTNSPRTIYKITFQESDLFPPLYVAADGSVIYPDLQTVAVSAHADTIGVISGGAESGLKLSDLPIKVATTIQEKAPTAEIAYINKIVKGIQVFYEITFKDPLSNPEMLVAEDGSLLKRGR